MIHNGHMEIVIPADMEYALSVGLSLDGIGMKTGLDMDALGDLRMLSKECLDTLIHQPYQPETIRISVALGQNRLHFVFSSENRISASSTEDALSAELTKSILETLMPEVNIESDAKGIFRILCSMPI